MDAKLRDAAGRLMVDFQQMSSFVEEPLVLDKGEGCWLWDVDGRRYFDGLSGVMVANYGHGNKEIIAAVTEQIGRLAFAAPTLATNTRALELVGLLRQLLPSYSTFKLLSGGSEVTEAAIKLARQYHKQSGQAGRYKVISLYRSYHGATLGALSATGHAQMRAPYEPLVPGFLHVMPPDVVHPPYGATAENVGAVCAQAVEDVIKMEGPETIAAFICEPVMQSAGVLIPPSDYLPLIREICDRHGVLLIYDEVITGCGRTGKLFAYQHSEGAEPDILCLGKGLTGGYAPLACVALRPNVGEAFWGPEEAGVQFHSGHTYGGNPVACAAGVAALTLLQRDGLAERSAASGAYLLAGLQRLADRWPQIDTVRGIGMLVAVEYVGADPSKGGVGQGSSDAIGLRVAAAARRRGLLFRRGPGLSIFGPPLVATRDELDWVMARFDEALGDARAAR